MQSATPIDTACLLRLLFDSAPQELMEERAPFLPPADESDVQQGTEQAARVEQVAMQRLDECRRRLPHISRPVQRLAKKRRSSGMGGNAAGQRVQRARGARQAQQVPVATGRVSTAVAESMQIMRRAGIPEGDAQVCTACLHALGALHAHVLLMYDVCDACNYSAGPDVPLHAVSTTFAGVCPLTPLPAPITPLHACSTLCSALRPKTRETARSLCTSCAAWTPRVPQQQYAWLWSLACHSVATTPAAVAGCPPRAAASCGGSVPVRAPHRVCFVFTLS